MKSISIEGTLRNDLGKKATKAIRKASEVPCVIYGGDKPLHFSASAKAFKHLIYTSDFKLASVSVNGTSYKCILKDMQFHPVTDEILHLDFLQLIDGSTFKAEIPVRFKGAAPGVKTGGKLMQKMRRVKVKTMPENLVDTLYADISTLELGQSIRVRDIETPEGIEIMSAMASPIGSIEIPRALRSAAAKEATEAKA